MNKPPLIGTVLVAGGFLYLLRPDLFRRGVRLKTMIAIQMMSPETYAKYIRGLDLLFIVVGAGFVVHGMLKQRTRRLTLVIAPDQIVSCEGRIHPT